MSVSSTSAPLDIVPLGGMGSVTQNMFLYVIDDEILIVDCGIGFPDIQMLGADILIPDTRYLHQLLDQGKRIVGMLLTHGHDDHIAATPYILPELPEFPIYGSPLTAGFAQQRMSDGAVVRDIKVIKDKTWTPVSANFSFLSVHVTHSVPDTKHFFIKTPAGVIYHGADFKLDKGPVDHRLTDEEAIAEYAKEGVLCQLIDCLRVERSEWVGSESAVGPAIESAMLTTKGKCLVTLMSSHIHRIQQTVDAAVECGRKIAFVGRSVEQNVDWALRLQQLDIPQGVMLDKRDIEQQDDSQLCVVIAGSQGQEGSSLMRAVYGEHPILRLTSRDKVIFSADAIPGNEIPYFEAIDELCRNEVEVIYPDIVPAIHQSGHASSPEQQHLVELVKADYVMPIGGADRHRRKFVEFVAEPIGLAPDRVLIPTHGEVIRFVDGKYESGPQIQIEPRIVDGKGIGDVGPMVLSDRRALSQAGMIVLIVPRSRGNFDFKKMHVISRGFTFMKGAQEVLKFITEEATTVLRQVGQKMKDEEIKRQVERRLSHRLFKIIKREPMIVVEIFDY